MNEIELIVKSAKEELSDSDYQSTPLNEPYEKASDKERAQIKEVLVCICGYQLPSVWEIVNKKADETTGEPL